MNRDELKKLMEEEFEDIKMTDKLKLKTIKRINEVNNTNIPHFPYLKNICAIFIVSLICLCVYLNKNSFYTPKDMAKSEMVEENFINDSSFKDIDELEDASSPKMMKSKSFVAGSGYTEGALEDYSTTYTENATMRDYQMLDNGKNEAVLLTEDEFIKKYPEAEKTDKGYIINEKLYVFEDGNLLEIIEI